MSDEQEAVPPEPPGPPVVALAVLVVLTSLLAGLVVALLLRDVHDDGGLVAPGPTTTAPPSTAAAATSTPSSSSTVPAPDLGGLPDEVRPCVADAFAAAPPTAPVDLATDPSVVVCAKVSLTDFLQSAGGLDDVVAACAADAVVDRLGIARVLALLSGARVDDAVATEIRAALDSCAPEPG